MTLLNHSLDHKKDTTTGLGSMGKGKVKGGVGKGRIGRSGEGTIW